MPLQNRVTPTGEIVADHSRGLMMGNRGCLHGQGRDLGVSRWRSTLWICCVLDWKGVRRDPMPPGRWTALFFLDEATALSAGHRPCAYCRRRDFLDFAEAWRAGRRLERRPWAREMDSILHRERVDRTRRQITHHEPGSGLPDGVMIRAGGNAGLLMNGRLRPWSFHGYGPGAGVPSVVEVLTPPSTVAAITAGYRPLVHPSALTDAAPPHAAPPHAAPPNAAPPNAAPPNAAPPHAAPPHAAPPGVRVHVMAQAGRSARHVSEGGWAPAATAPWAPGRSA